MSILDKIKKDIKNSGKNKGKILYFKDGVKKRVRFLCEFDDGTEVKWHDSYKNGINTPCLEFFGKHCKYCSDSDLRTRSQYLWSVWDYDANEVKILLGAVNNCSPIPSLASFYENYGTMLDRDYIIEQKGSGTSKTFSVVPCDKVKFTNKKASALSESAIKDILKKAYIDSEDDDEEEDELFEKPKAKVKSKSKKDEDEDDGIEWSTPGENSDDEDEIDYSSMSAKELYKLCKEREIDVEQKMKEKYYITKLKEADKAKEEWDDGEEDEWEEDDE